MKTNRMTNEEQCCHTLISSGDDCLSTFGFSPAELSCLTLIVTQSVGFFYASERKCAKYSKERQKGHFWGIFQPIGPPRPPRKLRDEVTSLPERAAVQPPPLISYK